VGLDQKAGQVLLDHQEHEERKGLLDRLAQLVVLDLQAFLVPRAAEGH
jgi:hypothetical protein